MYTTNILVKSKRNGGVSIYFYTFLFNYFFFPLFYSKILFPLFLIFNLFLESTKRMFELSTFISFSFDFLGPSPEVPHSILYI